MYILDSCGGIECLTSIQIQLILMILDNFIIKGYAIRELKEKNNKLNAI